MQLVNVQGSSPRCFPLCFLFSFSEIKRWSWEKSCYLHLIRQQGSPEESSTWEGEFQHPFSPPTVLHLQQATRKTSISKGLSLFMKNVVKRKREILIQVKNHILIYTGASLPRVLLNPENQLKVFISGNFDHVF